MCQVNDMHAALNSLSSVIAGKKSLMSHDVQDVLLPLLL